MEGFIEQFGIEYEVIFGFRNEKNADDWKQYTYCFEDDHRQKAFVLATIADKLQKSTNTFQWCVNLKEIPIEYENEIPTVIPISDDTDYQHYCAITRNASVEKQPRNKYINNIELVSKILKVEDLERDIRDFFNNIAKLSKSKLPIPKPLQINSQCLQAFSIVEQHNETTSQHVHFSFPIVDQNTKHLEMLKRLCISWLFAEPIFTSMCQRHRWNNDYCSRMYDILGFSDPSNKDKLHKLIELDVSQMTIEDIVQTFQPYNDSPDIGRYAALNLLNLTKANINQRTIEVRIKEGDPDVDKMIVWVNLLAIFFKKSLTDQFADSQDIIQRQSLAMSATLGTGIVGDSEEFHDLFEAFEAFIGFKSDDKNMQYKQYIHKNYVPSTSISGGKCTRRAITRKLLKDNA